MLASLTTTPKKAKAKKEYSDIEDDLDDDFNNDTVDGSFYNKDPVVPVDPVVPGVWSTRFLGRSPPPGRHSSMVLGIPSIPTMSSIQLYQTAETDVNILGLIVIVGNSKCVLDNGRGYLNYMRITMPLTSPADYEKIELTLLPDPPQLL